MPTEESNFSRYVIPDEINPVGDCCICVPVPNSREYIAQFLGAIWRMGIQSHYERDAAHSGAVVAAKWRAIWLEVQTNMGCCDPNILNQYVFNDIKYTNIKLIMQSIRQQYIDASLDVQVAFINVPDDWDADPGDIGDEIDDRNRALCLAVRSWVDELCNQGMVWLEGAATDVIPIAAGAILLPSVPTWLVSMAGVGMLLAGAKAYEQLAFGEYREYLACAMYENLQGEATTDQDSWDAALDTFPHDRPVPEDGPTDFARDLIETWFRSQLNNLDNYLAFVSNLQAAMSIASTLDDSDCGCLGFSHLFDFTIDEQGWTDRAEDSRPYAIYSPGVGWTSGFFGVPETPPNATRLYIQITDFDVTTITRIEIFYTATGAEGGGRSATIRTRLADAEVDFDVNTLWSVPSVFKHNWDGGGSCDEIEQDITNPTGSDNSDITITAILVVGLGSNPFD